MHEYPAMRTIVDIATRHAAEHGAARVRAIHLTVGENSGYLPESLALYFDLIAGDGPCRGARLEFSRVQPKLRCTRCGALFVRKPFEFACPAPDCGGDGEPTDIGREFFVDRIEVESGAAP